MPRAADIKFKSIKQVVKKLWREIMNLNGVPQRQEHRMHRTANRTGFKLAAPLC
jgi:hypothetical protein